MSMLPMRAPAAAERLEFSFGRRTVVELVVVARLDVDRIHAVWVPAKV